MTVHRPSERATTRPHHRETNVYSPTFQLIWEPKRKLIAHQCCDQLTAVKTGYPVTIIIWPYRRLKCRPIEVEYFFLSYPLTNYQFQMIAGSSLFFSNDSYEICYLGRKNSARFLKIQAGKTFSYHGHSLFTLYVQFLCSNWSKFDRWL